MELKLKSIVCPLCHEVSNRPVLTSADVRCHLPGRFTVVRCEGCNHRYLNPRPADECLADCYPVGYAPHQAVVAALQTVHTEPQLQEHWKHFHRPRTDEPADSMETSGGSNPDKSPAGTASDSWA